MSKPLCLPSRETARLNETQERLRSGDIEYVGRRPKPQTTRAPDAPLTDDERTLCLLLGGDFTQQGAR